MKKAQTAREGGNQKITLDRFYNEFVEFKTLSTMRINDLEQRMDNFEKSVDQKFDIVLVNLDKIMHKLEALETERYATIARFERIEKVVFNE